MAQNSERVQVANPSEWRGWLEENHGRDDGVWLVTFKKRTGDKYVSYDEVVETALCFGWIDSLPRKLDDDRTMLWLSPRQPGSSWSQRNKERLEKMVAAGLMTPAGFAKLEVAKQDGSWHALDDVDALNIPPDLAEALAAYDAAEQNFGAFPPSAKRGILEWIATAKKPETRAKRVAETARLAQDDVRANQWRG